MKNTDTPTGPEAPSEQEIIELTEVVEDNPTSQSVEASTLEEQRQLEKELIGEGETKEPMPSESELMLALQRYIYKRAGFIDKQPPPKMVEGGLLAMVRISKELFICAHEIDGGTVEGLVDDLRDGLYLVLQTPSNCLVFGDNKKADKLKQNKTDENKLKGLLKIIQTRTEFEKLNQEMRERQQLEEETEGTIAEYKALQGGLLIKTITQKEKSTHQRLFLKTSESIIPFGGKWQEAIEADQINMYYEAIQDMEEFNYFNEEIARESMLKKLKEAVEKIKREIIDYKAIKGGLLAQVISENGENGNIQLVCFGEQNGLMEFGGKQSKKIDHEEVMTHYNALRSEEEFCQSSLAIEQMKELKEIEAKLKKEGWRMADCKAVEGGYIIKVLRPKPNNTPLFLMLVNHEIKLLGDAQAAKITPDEINAFFGEIITAEQFEDVSKMFEVIRSNPKKLPPETNA